jgi:hypothetical protein
MSRRRGRGSFFGRVVETMLDLILVLIVLLFGFSIAGRFSAEGRATVKNAERRAAEPLEMQAPRTARAGAGAGAERSANESRDAGEQPVSGRPVTVDIRNGCGRVGLAEDMMTQLRRAGFDVVEYRNADRYDYEKTQVLDRAGKPEAAARVQGWLQRAYGVGEVRRQPVPSPEADVLLILGADLADTLRKLERAHR